MCTMVYHGNTYEVVDTWPLGYEIWQIGDNAPDGYVPLCRLKMVQPFDGARDIEPDTLKLIRSSGARAIMNAAHCGLTTLARMETFLEQNRNAVKGTYEATLCHRVELALPHMRELTTRNKNMSNFEKKLDTFTTDSKGNVTKDRFVRLEGHGLKVLVTFFDSGYVNITVSRGMDFREWYGPFGFNFYIEYNDIEPERAVVSVPSMDMYFVEGLCSYLNKAGEAIDALNELIQNVNKI